MEKNLRRASYFGNSFLGLFLSTNNSHTIFPPDASQSLVDKASAALKTIPLQCSVFDSNLLGVYTAMNSNGMLLPENTSKETAALLKKETGLNVSLFRSKLNANGNNIAANDKGGIANPRLSKKELKAAEDCLGVEIVPMSLCGYTTVGSLCIATNRGFLVHFQASEREREELSGILKVRGMNGTANLGTGFVSVCMLANDKGYIAGEATSVYELGRAEEALGFLG